MKPKLKLSAIVITRNEEARIAPCLKALHFADELLVVDNNSGDATAQIAKGNGAKVITVNGSDFSVLRNKGRDATNGDWLLYIDADELVTQDLAAEIVKTIAAPGIQSGFFLQRKNSYLGVEFPKTDRMQRLFKRADFIGFEGNLHETAKIKGSFGDLSHPLLHNTHRTLEEMVEKTNEWSQVEALNRLAVNHPPVTWWRLLRVMITGFFQSFIKEEGYRAGQAGWIEAIFQAFSMFITYAKLWELQQKQEI